MNVNRPVRQFEIKDYIGKRVARISDGHVGYVEKIEGTFVYVRFPMGREWVKLTNLKESM